MHVVKAGILVFGVMLLAVGCGPMTLTIGDPGDQTLKQTVVVREPGWCNERIAIIDVTGMLLNGNRDGLLRQGENPVAALQEKLHEVQRDNRVRAVILRLNTPGGTVTASDAMYGEVMRFKRESGKPVVALLMDVAASGGYYLACASDEIVAQPTSVTGSIGVIVQTLSVKPALSRIGVNAEAITSGPNKDVGSPLTNMTEGHREVLRGLVDDFYARFVGVVRERRPGIPAGQFESVTDGRVMSGEEAVKLGLADATGDVYEAFRRAKARAGLHRADLVLMHRAAKRVASVYAQGASPLGDGSVTQINLAQINVANGLLDAPAGFYYLWSVDMEGSR